MKTRRKKLPELDERERYVFQFCRKKVERLIADHGTPRLMLTEPHWFLRLPSPDETRPFLIDCRSDLILWFGDSTLHVVDYKAGFLDVGHASSNLQVWCYLLSALQILSQKPNFQELPSFETIMESFDLKLYGHILQPFAEEPHTIVEVHPEDISPMVNELVDIIKVARKKGAPRVCGVDQCRWCKAKGTERCPESAELVDRMPVLALKGTPMQRSEVLQKCAVAKKIIAEIESQAKELLQRTPGGIVDWIVTDPVKVRTVEDLVKAYSLLQQIGVTQEDFQGCLKFSVPAMVKLLHIKNDDMTQKNVKGLIAETLKEVMVTSERSGHLEYKGKK